MRIGECRSDVRCFSAIENDERQKIPLHYFFARHLPRCQATTYAELRFERGIVSYRWHWWDGELYERQTPKSGIHPGVLPPFRQRSPAEFVAYHITLGMPLRVKFESANGGKALALAIVTPKGDVRAARISP